MKLYDLRRLLSGKTTLVFALTAPVVLVLLIALMVAPYFYADVRTQGFTVAVFNEDDDPLTVAILDGLIESKSLGGLIETEFVESEDEGIVAVENGAAAYIHIPSGLQQTLKSGGQMNIAYYGNPRMPLEDRLLLETLSSGIGLVSHAQHAANALYYAAYETDPQVASEAYTRMSGVFFANVLMRDGLYEDKPETSPLGGALPLEYYAASLLVLFVALGALPIARITADDNESGLLHRQLLAGRSPLFCFVSRWLSGAVFLFLQYAVLALALSLIAGTLHKGSAMLLLGGGLLICFFLSLGALFVGLVCKTGATAVRAVFLSALALALLGGLLLPSAYMPAIVRDISYVTPFSVALKLCLAGLFDRGAGGLWLFAGLLGIFTAALLPFGLARFQRRAR